MYLARDPVRVYTKDELMREVWGFRSPGATRTLDCHASQLRRKLAHAGADGLVCAMRGVGYRLAGDSFGGADGDARCVTVSGSCQLRLPRPRAAKGAVAVARTRKYGLGAGLQPRLRP